MKRRLIGTVVGDRLVVSDGQDIRRLDSVLEDRCAPMMHGSDRAFLENRHDNNGLEGLMAQRYRDRAKAAGINISGKVYMGTLADQRGPADPSAWVSSRDDVLSVRREREQQLLRVTANGPPKSVRLAEDIVDEFVAEELKVDPGKGATPQKLAELREQIVDKHGAPLDG